MSATLKSLLAVVLGLSVASVGQAKGNGGHGHQHHQHHHHHHHHHHHRHHRHHHRHYFGRYSYRCWCGSLGCYCYWEPEQCCYYYYTGGQWVLVPASVALAPPAADAD